MTPERLAEIEQHLNSMLDMGYRYGSFYYEDGIAIIAYVRELEARAARAEEGAIYLRNVLRLRFGYDASSERAK